jgi:hypothetical protein
MHWALALLRAQQGVNSWIKSQTTAHQRRQFPDSSGIFGQQIFWFPTPSK